MPRKPKLSYHYYLIPMADINDHTAGDPTERALLAILEAQDRARTWKVPAIWQIIRDSGDTLTVRRISHK